MRKWYTEGIEKLEESERYLLALVLPNNKDSLKIGRGIEIMEEYIEEATDASEEDDLLEAYDKEWALMDLGRQKAFIEAHEKEFKEGCEKGFADGHEKGFADGHEKGFADGHEKGYSEGQEKGYVEGMKKTTNDLIKKLLNLNVDIETIISATGLTREEIEKIK